MCQTEKYKNTNTKYTNTQVQHMAKCQEDQTFSIYLRISKIIVPCVKHAITKIQIQNTQCTNTSYDEVPERPSMWYIYEKG